MHNAFIAVPTDMLPAIRTRHMEYARAASGETRRVYVGHARAANREYVRRVWG